MIVQDELLLDYNSVLIKPIPSKINSRKEVDLTRNFKFQGKEWFNGIPIIAANMTTVGTMSMLKELDRLNCMTALHKYIKYEAPFAPQPLINSGWVSVGINQSDIITLTNLKKQNPKLLSKICIDVANGYTRNFLEFVKWTREFLPDSIIMAGNVIDKYRTLELLGAGANIIKVGIGPGSVCTTRKATGVGYPQLSAVIECADAAHNYYDWKNPKFQGFICADGGCTNPGDIAKAFAGGADFVMLGGLLSGHDECEGEIKDGQVEFYGMSSDTAMESAGIKESYRSSEGKLVHVPYRGRVENTINHILGGLRSTCAYTGSSNLKELHQNAIFVRTPNQYNTIFGDQ